MTGGADQVEARWLPGLGSSPGAVDLRIVGPAGTIARAVPLPEALMAAAVTDLLCPDSHWYETIRQLPPPPYPTHRPGP